MKKINLFLLLSFLLAFLGCQKDETEPESEAFEPVYFNGIAGTETGDSKYPYMVQHENGEVMVLTAVGDTPTGVIYFLNESNTVQMTFNEDLLPSQVVYNNEIIVLFENYRDELVDIAVIHNDDFQIYRDIDFPTQNVSKASIVGRQTGNWSGFFSALGTTINVGLCSIAAAATAIPSLGTSVPAAVITCGGALLGSVLLLSPSDSERLNATGATVGVAANGYGCLGSVATGSPLSIAANCINTMIDAAGGIASVGENLESTLTEIITAARGGLQTGDGDVKFTLTWWDDSDLDLYVTEPSGETIWYGNRASSTAGTLDQDDIDGATGGHDLFAVENIFWPTDFAIAGDYYVEVKMFRERSDGQNAQFSLKPKLGNNDNYNAYISDDLRNEGDVKYVGTYTLSEGSDGKLVGKWKYDYGIDGKKGKAELLNQVKTEH